MQRYFITGTDTDCGKTHVTKSIYKELSINNKVQVLKPVASGCYVNAANKLISSDDFIEDTMQYNWRFKLPVSPHIAYAKEGHEILMNAHNIWQSCIDSSLLNAQYQLIEGAGGLMVPINQQETWLDFLKISNIPVILVVGMRLGCINHALLTQAALILNQIKVAGWVANFLDPNFLEPEANLETLCDKLSMPLLGKIAYNSDKICYTYKVFPLYNNHEEIC